MAIKRSIARFPDDFMFQLTKEEFDDLRSQSVTSRSWSGRRHRPYAFTEQRVAMLSSVLRSDRAIHVNIQIMGAFVRLRRLLATHEELARKLDALELVPAAAVAPALPWRELAAMHNRIIHAYWDVNRDIVWKAATEEVPDLLPKLQALLAGQGDKRWWDASVLLRLMWEAWNEVFRDVIGPAEQTPLFEGGAA